MATQKQIDANRRNAQKSTGPRTAEGKARSSRNHLIHGLASQPRFPDVQDPTFIHHLWMETERHWPRSPEEAAVVANVALGTWLQRREARLSTQCFAAYYQGIESPDPAARNQAMADFSVALRALNRLGGRADRIRYPAETAWMRILGADPATIAEWEAEDREAQEEIDEDLLERGIEERETPEQAHDARAEHERFIQEVVRTHFGPGSHRVPPSWDAPAPPAATTQAGQISDSNPIAKEPAA